MFVENNKSTDTIKTTMDLKLTSKYLTTSAMIKTVSPKSLLPSEIQNNWGYIEYNVTKSSEQRK